MFLKDQFKHKNNYHNLKEALLSSFELVQCSGVKKKLYGI